MSRKPILHYKKILFLFPLLVISVVFGLFQLRPTKSPTFTPIPPVPLKKGPLPTKSPTFIPIPPVPLKKGPSGIDGVVFGIPTPSQGPETFLVADFELMIKDATGKKIIKKISTGKKGKFSVMLPEGDYMIVPVEDFTTVDVEVNGSQQSGKVAKVKVLKGYRTSVGFDVHYW